MKIAWQRQQMSCSCSNDSNIPEKRAALGSLIPTAA